MANESNLFTFAANCGYEVYKVTLTSFGPNPNRIRQYLRQRFVYTLAEALQVRPPIPLLVSIFCEEAQLIKNELESRGARTKLDYGYESSSENYPTVRISLFESIPNPTQPPKPVGSPMEANFSAKHV
jgi:hypothetical protein